MNFPDYYGENMDAWIDCVDELSDKPTLIENNERASIKGKSTRTIGSNS